MNGKNGAPAGNEHENTQIPKLTEQDTDDQNTPRIERLLRIASTWEPERTAPEGLAARALRPQQSATDSSRQRRSLPSRHWWSFGTAGLTVAASLLLYPKVLTPTTVAVSPAPTPSAVATVDPNTEVISSRALENILSESLNSAKTHFSADTETTPDKVQTASQHSPETGSFTPAVNNGARPYHSSGRRYRLAADSSERSRPRRSSSDTPPVVRWETETVRRPSYRMLVPVVLTNATPDGSGNSADAGTTPAVVEVAFDPTVPMATEP